uniref:Uncharacterized protein n=1 Tax=Bracon brevicornis TaxID=1563983 RepID=A0A6V7HNG0_9HYME
MKIKKIHFWTKKTNTIKKKQTNDTCPKKCSELTSRCLEVNNPPASKRKKSILNFCKVVDQPEKLEKPSNCPDIECKKRETFWEYLFGRRNVKKIDKQSIDEPNFSEDQEYVICREYSPINRTFSGTIAAPQPKSPPDFPPPKAIFTKRFVEKCQKIPSQCSAAAFFAGSFCCSYSKIIKPFKIPYDELRPPGNTKTKFNNRVSIELRKMEKNIFPLIQMGQTIDRISRLPGEIPKPPSTAFATEDSCDPEVIGKRKKTSRIERLKILTASNSSTCSSGNCINTK